MNASPRVSPLRQWGPHVLLALALAALVAFATPTLAQSDDELETDLELEASEPVVEPTPDPVEEPTVEQQAKSEPGKTTTPVPEEASEEPEVAPVKAKATAQDEPVVEGSKTLPAKTTSRVSGALFDPPNREFERRLNRIYRKNGDPISEDKWDTLISRQRAEAYRIRPSNTLSGISRSLFGDPQYWPKLWAENGSVENPHLIRPGRRVRFYPGTEEDAPAISLVDVDRMASELELPPPEYEVDEASLGREDSLASTVLDEIEPEKPNIPEPERVRRKPVDRLPPSFVNTAPQALDRYDATGLEIVRSRARTVPAQVIPTHYWVDDIPEGIGTITEIETATNVAGYLQNVFLRLNRVGSVGERFSIVYPDPSSSARLLPAGHVLEVGGVVEITEPVEGEDRVYRGIVVKSVGAIRKGSIAIEERLPRADLSVNGSVKDVSTRVIGGAYEPDRKVMGTAAVIYLEAGSGSGLVVGDLLAIRSKRGERRPDSAYPDAKEAIAIAKVVHVQSNGSTAFVVHSTQEVIPGDSTGGPLPSRGRNWVIPGRSNVIDIDYEVARARSRAESEVFGAPSGR